MQSRHMLQLSALALLACFLVPAAEAQFWVEFNGAHQWTPYVTFNPSSDEWWVAYVDHAGSPSWCNQSNSCSARARAEAFKPWGSSVRTRDLANILYIPDKDPYLAHNPHKNEFLAVWYDNARGSVWDWPNSLRADVKGMILKADGSPKTGVFNIAYNYNWNQARPKAAYNKVSRRYMVVWQEARTSDLAANYGGTKYRIRGQVVGDSGSLSGGNLQISNVETGNMEWPDIAAHNSQDKFLIAWEDSRHGTRHIFGQMFNSYGGRLFPSWDLIVGLSGGGSKSSRYPNVTYNYHDDQFVSVWHSQESGDAGKIYAQRMRGSDAAWIGGTVTVEGDSNNQFADIMYCPATQKYWITWGQTNSQVKAHTRNRGMGQTYESVISNSGKAASLPDFCRYDGQILVAWEEWHGWGSTTVPSIIARTFY